MADRILRPKGGIDGFNQNKPKPDGPKPRQEPWIETFSGGKFSLRNPVFKIIDIAHGLSNLSRFNGQCLQFYSVAEHSIAVSELMEHEGNDPFEGLMHDAVEAYLSDCPAPFKTLLPDWKKLEDTCELKMRRHFGIRGTKSRACDRADKILVHIEAFYLLKSKGEDWEDHWGVKAEAEQLRESYRPLCLAPAEAKELFLKRYNELVERRSGAGPKAGAKP